MATIDNDVIPLIARGRSLRVSDAPTFHSGSVGGLTFELRWVLGGGLPTKLIFWIGDIEVWSTADRPRDEVWSALIEGLTGAWNHLRLDQRYPLGLCPRTPSALETALERVLLPSDVLERTFDRFRRCHDVSRWVEDAGVRTPALWMLREGADMLLDASGVRVRWRLGDVLRTLSDLVDAILERAGARIPASVTERWRRRGEAPEGHLEAISLGIAGRKWRALRSEGVLREVDRRCLLEDGDEVMAVARMLIDRIQPDALAGLLAHVRDQGPVATPELDACSRGATELVEGLEGQRPFKQGHALALWFRNEIGLAAEGTKFDPRRQLDGWGVPVIEVDMERSIEAVAFWGARHGPAVLLNPKGRSNSGSASGLHGGMMATLAHEICHLLIDRGRALPVADALGGEVPSAIEERARSFAAEVLLPQAFAASALRRCADIASTVDALVATYGVSRTVAAWQIYNGGTALTVKERDYLSSLVGPLRTGVRVEEAGASKVLSRTSSWDVVDDNEASESNA